MGIIHSLFGGKEKALPVNTPLGADMHCHVLPGLDDGSPDLQQSVALIRAFSDLGYKKIVATPHIMADFYRNTPETIHAALRLVKEALIREKIDIEIDAAAEYYLDETFLDKLERDEPLLTFGDRYVLFETSYVNESRHLNTAIFRMKTLGYKPVLAHPERYTYLYRNFANVEDIFQRGVFLQVNINSLSGYYSPAAKKLAEKLIDKGMVHALGTDCHSLKHIDVTRQSMQTKHFRKALEAMLINYSL